VSLPNIGHDRDEELFADVTKHGSSMAGRAESTAPHESVMPSHRDSGEET
jgi:hypothetical protein